MSNRVQELQSQLDALDAELVELLAGENANGKPLAVRVGELVEQSRMLYASRLDAEHEWSVEQVLQQLETDFLALAEEEAALRRLDQRADALKERIREAVAPLRPARQSVNAQAEGHLPKVGGLESPSGRGWQSMLYRARELVQSAGK